MISVYTPDAPFPVYDNPVWWSDEWDGREYGREFDSHRPFFEQFDALLKSVPKMARVQQGENINAEYTNCASYNKNCYLLFSSNGNEDCMYGSFINKSKSCIDNHNVLNCELCAHSTDSEKCYACIGVADCTDCSECVFCSHCSGCRNCYGCTNLRNNEYCYMNEQLSKDEYERRIAETHLSRYGQFEREAQRCRTAALSYPRRCYEGTLNENVTGNYLMRCRNVRNCFESSDLEDCAHCSCCHYTRDVYDVAHYGISETNELLLEGEGIGHGAFRVLFSKLVWGGSSDVLYSYECFSSHHLFGCTGLKKDSFCILNKQYPKEEYERLVPTIIEHMRGTHEYGEFFPITISPFGYNESLSQDYWPIAREDAVRRDWPWRDIVDDFPNVDRMMHASDLPDASEDVPDDILNWAIKSAQSGRPFRITKPELALYRQLRLPIPHLHPEERHKARHALRNPRHLWTRPCMKCGQEMQSTYAPERPEIVYCEACYLASVY